LKTLTLAIISIIAVGSVGTSYALLVHNEAVQINGNLKVIDGNFDGIRKDGLDSGFAIHNEGGASLFTFDDIDDSQVYRMKLTGNGDQFQFLSFTDNNREDIVIDTATGKIGVNQTNPQEALHVGGNLKVDGSITSDGDICIGNCP
jgi:hypothetical protein